MNELPSALQDELKNLLTSVSHLSYTDQMAHVRTFLIRNKLTLQDVHWATPSVDTQDRIEAATKLQESLTKSLKPSGVPAVSKPHPHETGSSEG